MSRWRLFCCFLTAAAMAAAIPSAPVQAQRNSSEQTLPSRQILVMLKVTPQHFRPEASYGGRYGDAAAVAERRRAAERIAKENGLKLMNGWPMPLLGVDCFVMQVPDGLSINEGIARVSRNSRVAWSEPVQLYQARAAPVRSDPLLPVEPAAAEWRLADLHKFANGKGVSVAIVDSQVQVTHPDLLGHFVADKNFLATEAPGAEQHGTAVAGIIGAAAGNGIGIAGIAPKAQLMALRACWQMGGSGGTSGPTLCESLALARALQYAIDHNARVINLSLSGPPGILLSKLISIALAHNASVVAAYDPSLPRGGFPASVPGVVAVADQSLQNLPASVYTAPGRDIPTTQPGGKWYLVNGSSFAVAHVSGLIALVRERRSTGSLSLARSRSGTIDACATLLRTSPACDCDCRVSQASRLAGR